MTVLAANRQNYLTPGLFLIISISFHGWLLIKLPALTAPADVNNSYRDLQVEIVTQQNTATTENNTTKQVKHNNRAPVSIKSSYNQNKKAAFVKQKLPENSIESEHKVVDKKSLEHTQADLNLKPKKVYQGEKNSYLKSLLEKIEQNKFYPGIARRRGMEDMVEITFYVSADGEIIKLDVQSKFKALRKAAHAAIMDSLPFSPLPDSVTSPLKIQYAMAFKLQ